MGARSAAFHPRTERQQGRSREYERVDGLDREVVRWIGIVSLMVEYSLIYTHTGAGGVLSDKNRLID